MMMDTRVEGAGMGVTLGDVEEKIRVEAKFLQPDKGMLVRPTDSADKSGQLSREPKSLT